MVHFIEKPRRKKVARLSRYLRAIYDGEKVTLRYDNTKILSGQKRNGNHKKTKICTLENFLEEAQKIKSHNHESYTFDQPDHVFEFYQNDEGGFNGSFMDIDIEVFRKEDRLFATFGIASYELYKGDLEGSIRDLIGGCLW